jgi:hypothetical protein
MRVSLRNAPATVPSEARRKDGEARFLVRAATTTRGTLGATADLTVARSLLDVEGGS